MIVLETFKENLEEQFAICEMLNMSKQQVARKEKKKGIAQSGNYFH